MNFVNIRFLKNGLPYGRRYAYKTELELRPGDKVELPDGKVGIVVGESVDAGWVETYGVDNLKSIFGKVEKYETKSM